jgi:oxygen-independent coproporphyrinogen-3 oxidase
MTSGAGLYIHFPFCRTKCPYCHFASRPQEPGLLDLWWRGLEQEATLRAAGFRGPIDTVYLGGGTPSLLPPEDVRRLLTLLGDRFDLRPEEVTLEANPGLTGTADLLGWRDAGVTRLSAGVQGFDDRLLRILGRAANSEETEAFCRAARDAGFAVFALDLMAGVPLLTRDGLRRTLGVVRDLAPDHASLYLLENLEGLPFEAVVDAQSVSDDEAADQYELAKTGLEAMGLRRYEISNFARPGRECLHNLKYWRYEPFLGLGPSAASHLGGRRWTNFPEVRAWAAALERGEAPEEEVVVISPDRAVREALVAGLRLDRGVSLDEFRDRFGFDVTREFGREIERQVAAGNIVLEGDVMRLAEGKALVSNGILSAFA